LERQHPAADVRLEKVHRFIRARLTILAVLAAALCAAVAAHAGIDIAGDYLLRDDTYDHVNHGSREIVSAIAMLCAAGAGTLFVRQLFCSLETARSRVRLMRIPRATLVRCGLAVPLLALGIVPLMETIDTLRAGGDIDSLADAFGGSLLLGCGTTLLCAAVVCALVFGIVAWLCRHREHVARIVGSLLERARAMARIAFATRIRTGSIPRSRELRAQRRGKRGPPLRPRIIPVSL
jgi:TRAP-type C4-dicarboxylate transport system permease small subunit